MSSILAVGDQFIPAEQFREVLDARAFTLPGSKAEQHEAQQLMERGGAGAVPAPPELLSAIGDAEVLCVHFAPVSADVFAAGPRLKLVAVARTGLENVDIDAATERGIGVVPVFGRNASAVAELQIGLMLAEARNIARADASVKSGQWRKEFPGARIEIGGRTVGMLGFGHVGRRFAEKLSGFRPRLLAYDPYVADDVLVDAGVERAGNAEQIFSESDFVVVQLRHSAETNRMIGAKQLELMKPEAYFINVSRSRVVDTDALYDALENGRISGAGLDVFDSEPLPADSPWRSLDNVTFTTHFGGDTVDTNRTSVRLVADAVEEFLATGRCATAANAAELGWV
ncbi:2-hydroxyacid dehydrogenase [Fodinicola acaciae]|uniref:2-hydroxyacid dehydrogenase n=1 Tax=Fodinicola acaciae TaxID=2681555 RepID=UPI001C9E49F4|nr:2-hydroxyacid dehydrogenase [Fodinicola acaciae]